MENELDWNRIEDAALALLYLTLHDGSRVWKQISWDVTDRLHEKRHDRRSAQQDEIACTVT